MARHGSAARSMAPHDGVVRPHQDTGNRIRASLYVVEQEANPRGRAASPADHVEAAASLIRVGTVMRRDVLSVKSDASVETVTDALLDDGIHSVIVADDLGKPIGMLSKTDILREIRDRANTDDWLDTWSLPRGLDESELSRGYNVSRVGRVTAGEVMMPLCFAAREHDSLAQVAALLAFEGVRQVPVVGDDGRLVGIVSTLDVSRWLAAVNGYVVPDSGRRHRR